jgi:MoxR-like ATPase
MSDPNNDLLPEDEKSIEPTNANLTPPEPTAPVTPPSKHSLMRKKIDDVLEECGKIIVGQSEMLELIIIAILSDGHILLEGVPGIAKTLAAKTVATTIDADFSRIQFTPDLMPTDIIGTSVFNMSKSKFKFKKGPIFSNVVLIDEINRAPAKTQSALFEVMEEKQISYDGIQYDLEPPFIVIATQNPIEQEGTYRLPEAQLDRFLMKIQLDYPSTREEILILNRFKNNLSTPDLSQIASILSKEDIATLKEVITNIYIKDDIITYIAELVAETRQHSKIYLGASPRASLALMRCSKVVALMEGRDFVIPEDIQFVAPHILNHRLILTPDAEMEGQTSHSVIKEIIKSKEVPR